MRHLTRRRPGALRAPRGMTIIELMVGLVIAAILMVAAAPAFQEYLANSRLRENGNVLYMQTLFAQSEAIKRNTTVRVTVSGSTVEVSDRSVADDPVVLKSVELSSGVTAASATVDFGGEGRPLDFASASIDLSHPTLTCSTETRCPGLRVDGGGGIRLCGDHTTNCE